MVMSQTNVSKGGMITATVLALFIGVYACASSLMNCTPLPTQPAPAMQFLTWKYKILFVEAPAKARTGADALAVASIPLDEGQLDALGKEGWELVTSYIEDETSFPNLGDTKYVTGLQPNVRPRRATLVFKHAVVSP